MPGPSGSVSDKPLKAHGDRRKYYRATPLGQRGDRSRPLAL